jgi:hypothetical protein
VARQEGFDVRCPNCAAEISALRDICPHCGASTDSAFDQLDAKRERGRSPQETLSNRRKVGLVAGGIFIMVLALGEMFPFGRHMSHDSGVFRVEPDKGLRDPVTIGAGDLFEAYHTDSSAAERRYGGREMVVTGEFLRTVPDGYGSIDMRLKTRHPDLPLGIDVDGHSVDAATKLQPGEMVTVSCRAVAGTGDDPWLSDCVIQPPAANGAPAAPAAPAPPPAPSAPPAPPAPR